MFFKKRMLRYLDDRIHILKSSQTRLQSQAHESNHAEAKGYALMMRDIQIKIDELEKTRRNITEGVI